MSAFNMEEWLRQQLTLVVPAHVAAIVVNPIVILERVAAALVVGVPLFQVEVSAVT